MPKRWTDDDVLALTREYQSACVLAAAAELDLFTILADGVVDAGETASRLGAHRRGVTILLDALVAIQLLSKDGDRYALRAGVADALAAGRDETVLPMVQHQANCLRRWAHLAEVVRTGKPAIRESSVRGDEADQTAFIGAMHVICAPVADDLVKSIQPLEFEHLLDVGGASGTWTIAFLRSRPAATATIFDLESVIPLARRRMSEVGMTDRVAFAAGDFLVDPLPGEADLAWISAIVHQNSRAQNRQLFTAVFGALRAGGQILIRDILMGDSRTTPVAGALFAVNMLVATEGGATFTFAELREDLEAAGFADVAVLRRDDAMNSIVCAKKAAAY